jgi:hypothetical protein
VRRIWLHGLAYAPETMRVAAKKSSHTNHGNKVTKSVLTECAWAASRTKKNRLKEQYNLLL